MKKILAILMILITVLSLVACSATSNPGSDSNSIADTDNPQSENPSQNSNEVPLKIGVSVYQLSAEFGDRAMQIMGMIRDKVNAEGGVNGQDMELVFMDIGTDQQGYIDAYLKLLDTDGVSGIVGTFYSSYVMACADFANEAKIPTINITTSDDLYGACPYFIIARNRIGSNAIAISQIAMEAGLKKPVFLTATDASYNLACDVIQEEYEKAGLSTAGRIQFDTSTTTDFSAVVLQAINTPGADGVVMFATGVNGMSIASKLYEYRYDKPVMMDSPGWSDMFIENVGLDAVKFLDLRGVAEYATTLERVKKDEFLDFIYSNGFTYSTTNWHDACYFDSVNLFVEAARLAGHNDPASVYKGLKQIKNYGGALTDYTWHDDGSMAMNVYETRFDKETGQIVVLKEVECIH